LPVQTIRNCVNEYLLKEIEKAPKNWPIIANGKAAFYVSIYLFLDRTVIGIPHASGWSSRGDFAKLINSDTKLADIKKLLRESKEKKSKPAHCEFWGRNT